jgi:hypothetical protein
MKNYLQFFSSTTLIHFSIRDQLYLVINTLLMLEPNDLASALIEKTT